MSEGAGLAASAVSSAVGLVQELLQKQDIAFSFWVDGQEETVLQDRRLHVTQFAVEETLFGLTHIEVMLTSKRGDIDLDGLIDQPASLTIHHKYLPELRHFSGIVVEAERGDSGHHRTSYRLLLQPALCRLDYGSDCRIFQGKSVPEIVDIVLKEHGIEDIDWRLVGEHETREFLVCYRETHLAFIQRILAEEGIFTYFEHGERGKCRLILTDNPDRLPDCPGQATLDYNSMSGGVHYGVYCSSLGRKRKLRSTAYRQRDYSFKNPAYNQEHWQEVADGSGSTGEARDYELYDYPGRYKRASVGKSFTSHKLEQFKFR